MAGAEMKREPRQRRRRGGESHPDRAMHLLHVRSSPPRTSPPPPLPRRRLAMLPSVSLPARRHLLVLLFVFFPSLGQMSRIRPVEEHCLLCFHRQGRLRRARYLPSAQRRRSSSWVKPVAARRNRHSARILSAEGATSSSCRSCWFRCWFLLVCLVSSFSWRLSA